jgi:hypothetical protein
MSGFARNLHVYDRSCRRFSVEGPGEAEQGRRSASRATIPFGLGDVLAVDAQGHPGSTMLLAIPGSHSADMSAFTEQGFAMLAQAEWC